MPRSRRPATHSDRDRSDQFPSGPMLLTTFAALRRAKVQDVRVRRSDTAGGGGVYRNGPTTVRRMTSRKPTPCAWCSRDISHTGVGRRRRYCKPACRQRAYEQRNSLRNQSAIPADAIILSTEDRQDQADRLFAVRCAAEDVATAVRERADHDELEAMCAALLTAALDAEHLR
jgi:hypothetical protein